MRWEDTDWIKLYRPPSWSRFWKEVSLEARGLFWALLLAVDKAGLIDCGADIVGSVCGAVNGNPDRVPAYLDELTTDGCVVVTRSNDGRFTLVVPNYLEAQTARSSDIKRKAQSRERARDKALGQRDERQLSMPKGWGRMSVVQNTQSHSKSHEAESVCNAANEMSQMVTASKDSKDSEASARAIPASTDTVLEPPPPGAPGSPQWKALLAKVSYGSADDKEPTK